MDKQFTRVQHRKIILDIELRGSVEPTPVPVQDLDYDVEEALIRMMNAGEGRELIRSIAEAAVEDYDSQNSRLGRMTR